MGISRGILTTCYRGTGRADKPVTKLLQDRHLNHSGVSETAKSRAKNTPPTMPEAISVYATDSSYLASRARLLVAKPCQYPALRVVRCAPLTHQKSGYTKSETSPSSWLVSIFDSWRATSARFDPISANSDDVDLQRNKSSVATASGDIGQISVVRSDLLGLVK